MTDRTIVPHYRTVAALPVEISADGQIEIFISGGHYEDEVVRTFLSIDQLEKIVAEAKLHCCAHQCWVDGGRVDPDDYWHFYPEED